MKKLALAALPLALAACQQSADSGTTTVDTEGTVEPSQAPSDVTPAPTSTTTPAPTPTATATGAPGGSTIPVAVQGRWGMVPADCTSTRGDAKGLLTISPTTLKFYESLARLGAIKERSDTAIRADYAFTGEGMNWTRDVALSVSGNKLTRLDRGGDEPGGPYSYTKCG